MAGVGAMSQFSTSTPPESKPDIKAKVNDSADNLTSLPTKTTPLFPRNDAKVNPNLAAISMVISVLAVPRIPDVPKSSSLSAKAFQSYLST
jgi:hypothetical protein